MPDDIFFRNIVALIESRGWPDKTAQEIDRDVQTILDTLVYVYFNGRKPPPPRPNASPRLLLAAGSLPGLYVIQRPRRGSAPRRRGR